MFDLDTLVFFAAGGVFVVLSVVAFLLSNKNVIRAPKQIESKETVKPVKVVVESKETTIVTASSDLSELTVSELKDMAKAHGITGFSKMNKSDLIEIITAHTKAHH
jgi:hypothetical protein